MTQIETESIPNLWTYNTIILFDNEKPTHTETIKLLLKYIHSIPLNILKETNQYRYQSALPPINLMYTGRERIWRGRGRGREWSINGVKRDTSLQHNVN